MEDYEIETGNSETHCNIYWLENYHWNCILVLWSSYSSCLQPGSLNDTIWSTCVKNPTGNKTRSRGQYRPEWTVQNKSKIQQQLQLSYECYEVINLVIRLMEINFCFKNEDIRVIKMELNFRTGATRGEIQNLFHRTKKFQSNSLNNRVLEI